MNSVDFSDTDLFEDFFNLMFVDPDPDRLSQMFANGRVFRDPTLNEVFNNLSVSSLMCKLLNDSRLDFGNPEVRAKVRECVEVFSAAEEVQADYIRDMANATAAQFNPNRPS